MTISCIWTALEKQIVFLTKRLIRVRSVRCFRSSCWVLRLPTLGPPLTDHVAVWIQVPAIRTPAVSVKAANAELFKQRFEFYESLILTPSKDIR